MRNPTLVIRGLVVSLSSLFLAACNDTPPPPGAIEQLADEYLLAWIAEQQAGGSTTGIRSYPLYCQRGSGYFLSISGVTHDNI